MQLQSGYGPHFPGFHALWNRTVEAHALHSYLWWWFDSLPARTIFRIHRVQDYGPYFLDFLWIFRNISYIILHGIFKRYFEALVEGQFFFF